MGSAELHVDGGGRIALSVEGGAEVALTVGHEKAIDLKAGGEVFDSGLKYAEVSNEYGTTITIGA